MCLTKLGLHSDTGSALCGVLLLIGMAALAVAAWSGWHPEQATMYKWQAGISCIKVMNSGGTCAPSA